MDSRRATVRNVRSKCRCSCVLQFTFRRAVSCVLHRPPSQVIHCIVLFLSKFCSELQVIKINSTRVFHIPSREGSQNQRRGRMLLGRLESPPGRCREAKARSTEYRTRVPGRPSDAETSTVSRAAANVVPRAGGLEARGCGKPKRPLSREAAVTS